jgi:hypothetical protein
LINPYLNYLVHPKSHTHPTPLTTMYEESGGMPLCQALHYKPIFTWLVKTGSLLPKWCIDLTRKMMASSVISQWLSVATKLSAIVNICKYRRFHEGHHFILMAMEVHDVPKHDMDCFIKECACFFHNRRSRGHLFLSFLHSSF